MLAHLANNGRCATLSMLPRANTLAVIRTASSSSGHKKDEGPVAVSGSDPNSSPMTQRPLPPDDGKVRK